MISSRCRTKFPLGDANGTELSDIRKALKTEIEKEEFLGGKLIKVWINEEEAASADQTSWDECIKQSSDCDIFIAMIDGEAGWQVDSSGIGICHAEFEAAYGKSPGKVRVVSLLDDAATTKMRSGADPDKRFLAALERANLFQAMNLRDKDALLKRVKREVRELLLQLSLAKTAHGKPRKAACRTLAKHSTGPV